MHYLSALLVNDAFYNITLFNLNRKYLFKSWCMNVHFYARIFLGQYEVRPQWTDLAVSMSSKGNDCSKFLGLDGPIDWRNELQFLARNVEWIAKFPGMLNELICRQDWVPKIKKMRKNGPKVGPSVGPNVGPKDWGLNYFEVGLNW